MSVEVKVDLGTLGKKFYDEKLKSILEPEHIGEFLAIEPYLERYVVDKDKVQVMLRAKAEMPESLFYFLRIGFKPTRMGWSSIKKIGGVSQREFFQNNEFQIPNRKSKIK